MMRRSLASCALVFICAAGCRDKSRTSDVAPSSASSPLAKSSAKSKSSKAQSPDVATFWKWFEEHAAALHDDKDLRATMESISAELAKVDPGVFAEIGQEGDDRLLVLTADGKKDLFPTVKEIHAARPKVAGWNIVAFRQRAKPGEEMAIEVNGKKLDPKTMKVLVRKEGEQVGLTVYIPGFTKLEDFGMGPYLILDHTIGEYDMETKVGPIDWASTDKAPNDAKPLTELPQLLDEALPPAP